MNNYFPTFRKSFVIRPVAYKKRRKTRISYLPKRSVFVRILGFINKFLIKI